MSNSSGLSLPRNAEIFQVLASTTFGMVSLPASNCLTRYRLSREPRAGGVVFSLLIAWLGNFRVKFRDSDG